MSIMDMSTVLKKSLQDIDFFNCFFIFFLKNFILLYN